MKKHIIISVTLFSIACYGIYAHSFWGGFLFGASAILLLVSVIGRLQFKKAVEIMENKIEKSRLES